jgi:hypothetical protein
MNNTVTTMQPSLSILRVKVLPTFDASKQMAALSWLLAVSGAPLTLWAGKPPPPPPPPSNYAYGLRQLSLPAGASSFGANGLNNAGQVVGAADFPNNEYVGCLWQPNGQTVQLPLLSGAQLRRARASSITDSGLLMAGYSVLYYSTNSNLDGQHATFWENTNTQTGFQARDWNDLMPTELGIHLIDSEVTSDGQYVVLTGLYLPERPDDGSQHAGTCGQPGAPVREQNQQFGPDSRARDGLGSADPRQSVARITVGRSVEPRVDAN